MAITDTIDPNESRRGNRLEALSAEAYMTPSPCIAAPSIQSLTPVRTNRPADLPAYFDNTWNLYELLFTSISDEAQFWSPSGWEWHARTDTHHPLFWAPVDDSWQYRRMFDWVPLPLDWPAEVNAFEAEAYCTMAIGSGQKTYRPYCEYGISPPT